MSTEIDYKKKYQELKEQFEGFVYNVSHDMHAPLRHIKGFTRLLLEDIGEDNLNKEQKEFADFIIKGVEESEQMMEALLRYSRLNTEEKFIYFNSKDIFNNIVSLCCHNIKDKKPNITLPKKFPYIIADVNQLQILMTCLIENSIKFCRNNDTPNISVNIKEDKQNYIFSVKDNSIGFPKDSAKDIFKIFKKLDPKSPGIGAGLALAEKIVKHHHGKIWAESSAKKGSTFYFCIPKNLGENAKAYK